MKTKLFKLLRLFKADVLLLGLFEKIALALIKKLTAFHCALSELLNQCDPRNGL